MRSTILIVISLIGLAQFISGHAYFATNPVPRLVWCTTPVGSCSGNANAQGPIWVWPSTQTTFAGYQPQKSCASGIPINLNATLGQVNPLAFTPSNSNPVPDPAANSGTINSWRAGSTQTISVFISQIHPPPTGYTAGVATDGWQIRARDGSNAANDFTAVSLTSFSYTNSNGTMTTGSGVGPWSSDDFQTGSTITITLQVPSGAAIADWQLQFIWSLKNVNLAGKGVAYTNDNAMWMSCADISVTSNAFVNAQSAFAAVIVTLAVVISLLF